MRTLLRTSTLIAVLLSTLPSAAAIFSATLPTSRSSQIGAPTTFFGSVINSEAETLTGCEVSLASSIDATFDYQVTDPATNALVGSANTPVEIGPNGFASYLLTLTANSAIEPTDVAFDFSCDGVANAPSFVGLNTLLFSASAVPTLDVIGLVRTLSNDGTVHLKSTGELGVFSLADHPYEYYLTTTKTTKSLLRATLALCALLGFTSCTSLDDQINWRWSSLGPSPRRTGPPAKHRVSVSEVLIARRFPEATRTRCWRALRSIQRPRV